MEVYGWAFLAGLAAVVCETLYARSVSFPLWTLPLFQPVIAYSIYRLVKGAHGNLISAVVVFGAMTLGLRILATLYMGKPVSIGVWVAVALVLAAQVARRF